MSAFAVCAKAMSFSRAWRSGEVTWPPRKQPPHEVAQATRLSCLATRRTHFAQPRMNTDGHGFLLPRTTPAPRYKQSSARDAVDVVNQLFLAIVYDVVRGHGVYALRKAV